MIIGRADGTVGERHLLIYIHHALEPYLGLRLHPKSLATQTVKRLAGAAERRLPAVVVKAVAPMVEALDIGLKRNVVLRGLVEDGARIKRRQAAQALGLGRPVRPNEDGEKDGMHPGIQIVGTGAPLKLDACRITARGSAVIKRSRVNG